VPRILVARRTET